MGKMYLGFLKDGTVGHAMHDPRQGQDLDDGSSAERETPGAETQRLSTTVRDAPLPRRSSSGHQSAAGDDPSRRSPQSPGFGGRKLSVLNAALAASVQDDEGDEATPNVEDGTDCSESDFQLDARPPRKGARM